MESHEGGPPVFDDLEVTEVEAVPRRDEIETVAFGDLTCDDTELTGEREDEPSSSSGPLDLTTLRAAAVYSFIARLVGMDIGGLTAASPGVSFAQAATLLAHLALVMLLHDRMRQWRISRQGIEARQSDGG